MSEELNGIIRPFAEWDMMVHSIERKTLSLLTGGKQIAFFACINAVASAVLFCCFLGPESVFLAEKLIITIIGATTLLKEILVYSVTNYLHCAN